MKLRDYVFLIILAVLVVGLMPAPSPDSRLADRPVAVALTRAARWIAVWFVLGDATPEPILPSQSQEMPDHVVNAREPRAIGADGHPLLDHGAGW